MGVEVSKRSVLGTLTRARIEEIGRDLGVSLRSSATKEAEVERLAGLDAVALGDVLPRLRREELRSVCRAHGLDAAGRARSELIARLASPSARRASRARDVAPTPYGAAPMAPGAVPAPGQIARVRHRQYLVDSVLPRPAPDQQTLVKLVCLDDDAPGRPLEVLWERELGAQVVQPEEHGLGQVDRLDPPRHFAAYLHALKWNCVTATDARLFQSPFRAGIHLKNYQLLPLKKALELPRVNLFIADDVGLGKTIEAGLVLQELMLRQRVDQVLIVCPAAVSLQWRDEMERRFGLRFEIHNREFVGRRRQERGFGVNPWTTYPRFIISYQTLRRPEYREPLLRHIGDRARKSLLILDEAHTAAPASSSKYAVDSGVTRVIRDVAPRFEHRLFLSATPHNGHSNSFSSLLEVLDPQRFTRGVPVSSVKQLDPVMVRRLKSDLIESGESGFPKRSVVQIDLSHDTSAWSQRYVVDNKPADTAALGVGTDAEIELSRLLGQYGELLKARTKRGRLVVVNLQKRLLSSIEAFYRTLSLHARSVTDLGGAPKALAAGRVAARSASAGATSQLGVGGGDGDGDDTESDEYGSEEDDQLDLAVESASRQLDAPSANARDLLDKMLKLAERARREPSPKVLALVDWIRRHQCPAAQIGGAGSTTPKTSAKPGAKTVGKNAKPSTAWSNTRVIIFTEYADTKRYVREILAAAFDGTDQGDARLMDFHGGMSDQQREEVQAAFNGPPAKYPVRVLLATDAAREGVNLQGHCADLFHFDVPWNPARLEQRNGRIDRTLQASKEVRCHYFFYPQRTEDKVLRTLVAKVDVIRRELGSLGTVVSERLEKVLEDGITPETIARLDEAERAGGLREVATKELESTRAAAAQLRADDVAVGAIFNEAKAKLDFDPALLRDAIDVGMELAGGSRMAPTAAGAPADLGAGEAFMIPEPPHWAGTFDKLRPLRGRDEPFWDWRKRPPRPVVFRAPETMTEEVVQLHLSHPLVQRVLDRFRAQGFAAHDLSRVMVIRNPQDALARVIAFGRLSLFGPGATRLHEEVIGVAAQWIDARGQGRLKPFAEAADRKALEQLERLLAESQAAARVGEPVERRLLAAAPADFAELWQHVHAEAEARDHAARDKLKGRGAKEAKDLRDILAAQKAAIMKELKGKQLGFDFAEASKDERHQYEQDRQHMEKRLTQIDGEMEIQPRELEAIYEVVLRRLEPVGLVYLWPATR